MFLELEFEEILKKNAATRLGSVRKGGVVLCCIMHRNNSLQNNEGEMRREGMKKWGLQGADEGIPISMSVSNVPIAQPEFCCGLQ